MDKAVYGFIGVAFGFFLTTIKDWWIERSKNQKKREYLCINVTCMLDRFISRCSDVVDDDGLCQGQPDKDDYSRIQISTPNFKPESLEVEWKSLPANMMYEILNFPLHIETANSVIDSTFDQVATPPNFSEGFEERQYQYATLGIKANELASKLRTLSKLPQKEAGDWDYIQYMRDKKRKTEELREMRCKHHSKMFKELPDSMDSKKSQA